jgi:chromate reductase
MKILALCGSLRAASINSALLRAAARLAPPGIEFTLYDGVRDLPHFNPDLEADLPPPAAALRAAVEGADALVIASPEYAHGVTGSIKNALDWLVGSEAFAGKPVAVLNESPRACHADAALRETLRTMAAVIVEAASRTIPLQDVNAAEHDLAELPAVASAVRESLDALVRDASLPPPVPPALPSG